MTMFNYYATRVGFTLKLQKRPQYRVTCDLVPFESSEADTLVCGLAASVSDVRVVAIGEATHGTAEFQFLRYLVIKKLIQRYGFSAILLEDPLGCVAFLPGGRVSEGHRLPAYWIWHSASYKPLMTFLANELDSVAVVGMDPAPGQTPDYVGGWVAAFGRSYQDSHSGILPELDLRFSQLLLSEKYEGARVPRWPFVRRYQRRRDQGMSRVVEWAADEFGRVVILAHNYHVASQSGWTGGYLRERLGEDYVAIAMTTSGGIADIRKEGQSRIEIMHPPASSIEAQLANASDTPLTWLRHNRQPGEGCSFGDKGILTLTLGAGDSRQQYAWIPVESAFPFDHIVYIRETHPASAGVESTGWKIRG